MSHSIPKLNITENSATNDAVETILDVNESLEATIKIVDLKIAHFYLTGGRDLKTRLNRYGYLKCETIDEKGFLGVERNIGKKHKPHLTSLERAIAASAIFVIRRLESMKQVKVGDGCKMLDLSETTDTYFQLEYDGKKIFNPLADFHGLKPSNELYYIYNIGLEFMIHDYPVQALALLSWRYKHHDIIYSNRSGAGELIQFSRVDNLSQATEYYEIIAKTNNINSIEKLWESYLPHIRKFTNYLKEINPPDRHGRKVETRKTMEDLILEIHDLLS